VIVSGVVVAGDVTQVAVPVATGRVAQPGITPLDVEKLTVPLGVRPGPDNVAVTWYGVPTTAGVGWAMSPSADCALVTLSWNCWEVDWAKSVVAGV
jgi:hypothetical protein